MNKRFITYLSGYDEQPPAVFSWPENCQLTLMRGAESAQFWLANQDTGWLWAHLISERDFIPAGAQRRAYEVGFLSRIHQRLCSPRGGGHEAKLTIHRLT